MAPQPVAQISTTPPLAGTTLVDNVNADLIWTLMTMQSRQRALGFARNERPWPQYARWTPTLSFTSPGDLNVVYSQRSGSYVKLGRLVIFKFTVTTTTFTFTTATGDLIITGVPFGPGADSVLIGAATPGSLQWGGITKANYTDIVPTFQGTGTPGMNQGFFNFSASGSAQALSTVTTANAPTTSTMDLRGMLQGIVDN